MRRILVRPFSAPVLIVILVSALVLSAVVLVVLPGASPAGAETVAPGDSQVASPVQRAQTVSPMAGPEVELTAAPEPMRTETVTVSVDRATTITFAEPAEHVAAYWQDGPEARVTLAFSTDGVHFGEPIDAGRDDAEGDPRSRMTYGAISAAGGATVVRIGTDTPLTQLSVIGMSPGESASLSTSPAALSAAADPGGPAIISRSGWGANPTYLNWSPQFYPPTKVIIHHTADGTFPEGTPESYAKLVRSIYYYHAVTRDWGDIAYNFLIDPLGNIYEGRYSDDNPDTVPGEDAYGNGVRGGHAYNYNSATLGIAVLGTYSKQTISAAAQASLEELLAWMVERHGIDPVGFGPYYSPYDPACNKQSWNITGHRDYGSTSCPGDAFYNTLPLIRQNVFALTGPVTAPTPSPTYMRLAIIPEHPVMGQDVTVKATLVEDSSRQAVSGVSVSFSTGGIATAQTSVGTATTDSSGVASVQMMFTAAGMRWVTADFNPGTEGNAGTEGVSGTTGAHRGSTTSAEVNVAPTGLVAVPGMAVVQLSWTSSPDAEGYNVYRDGTKINSAVLTSPGYLDGGLTNGVAHSYQVTAIVYGRESARSPAVSAIPKLGFVDVTADHAYYRAVMSLAAAGVVNGKDEGRFYPDDLVMRQQFAKMIVLGCEYPVAESDRCLFKDVTKSGTSSLYPDNYVAVCAAREITVGKNDVEFDPYSPITRAQVATMVVRAAQDYKPPAVEEPPTGWRGELSASDPTHGANIACAEYSGLLAGIDLSTFATAGFATRGEIAQIICNLREK